MGCFWFITSSDPVWEQIDNNTPGTLFTLLLSCFKFNFKDELYVMDFFSYSCCEPLWMNREINRKTRLFSVFIMLHFVSPFLSASLPSSIRSDPISWLQPTSWKRRDSRWVLKACMFQTLQTRLPIENQTVLYEFQHWLMDLPGSYASAVIKILTSVPSVLFLTFCICYMSPYFYHLALRYWSHLCLAVCQWRVRHSSCLAHWEGRRHQFAQH